jgi:hypothetical protein
MRGQPNVVSDFRGGVNLAAAPYSLDGNQARDVRNVNSSIIGSLHKRNGFDNLAEPTLPIKSLFGYNGSSDFLVGVGDDGASTDVYKITSAGTVTSIKGAATISVGHRWDMIQAPASGGQGALWMVNGSNTPKQWTGAGNIADWTASAGTLPNGKYIQYFDNRVFIAGVSSDPSKLYWSAIGDPRNWATPDGGFTTFDPDDGEAITGLGTVGPYLLVFKASKTYVVFNTDTGGYRRVSNEIGCIAHESIVESDGGTFFLSSSDRIMVTDGNSMSAVSDNALEPLLGNLTPTTNKLASGHFHDQKYYLSMSQGGSDNDIIIEFDTRFQSWWLHEIQVDADTTDGVCCWAQLNPANDDTLYCVGCSGIVFKAFDPLVIADNGVTYEAYWVTQWHTFTMPHIRKIMRQLRADALGNFNLEVAFSFSTAFDTQADTIWESAGDPEITTFGGEGEFGGSGTFGGSNIVSEHHYYTLGTARAFSFKFLSNDALEWELYAYTMAVDRREN